MKILLDENVSMRLAGVLRKEGNEVVSIAEIAKRGMADVEIWSLAREAPSLLVTRDYHFTNSIRFDPAQCLGVVFLRHGNLTANVETALVRSFLASRPIEQYQGKLVTLAPKEIRIR